MTLLHRLRFYLVSVVLAAITGWSVNSLLESQGHLSQHQTAVEFTLANWSTNLPLRGETSDDVRDRLSGVSAQDPETTKQDEHPTFEPKTDLVKDWKQPTVTLFVSGNQSGYIEPCGCTGLENQKGGLMRRADCQKILLDRKWDLVSIDAGKQIRRVAIQANRKLQATYQTLCRVMKYDVVSFGIEELKLAGTDLAQALVDSVDNDNPFMCSNITVLDESLSSRFRVVEKNGKRIGIASILGDEFFADIQAPEITKLPWKQALTQVVPMLQQQRCDMLVLIAQTNKETCVEIAQQFPVFDLIVTGAGEGEPMMLPEKIAAGNHTTQLIEVGTKGMYVGLVGCDWENGNLDIKYERVAMDARFDDEPNAKKIFISYQDQLRQLYLSPQNFPDITARKHPSGGAFAGSDACADCHDEDYEIWKEGIDGEGGPHFRATLDLTDPIDNPRAEIKRNFDPECLSCHVTGWNPQKFFPYETGYYDLKKDTHLHGNGCENCHGPGKRHVDAENGDIDVSEEEIDKLRKALYVTKEQAAKGMCIECHDIDNSPDFLKEGFDVYWEKIKHGNVDD